MLYELGGVRPVIAEDAWVAPDATVIGDVWLGSQGTIWFKAVVRGDTNRIRIGARTNVQDGSVLHVNPGEEWGLTIGEDVTIGHACIVHACTLEDHAFVGMGALAGAGGLGAGGRPYLVGGVGVGLFWWGVSWCWDDPHPTLSLRERAFAMRVSLVLAVVLAGCAGVQPTVPDSARLAPGALGTGFDPDVTAANLAQWAFADSGRTYGRPIDAARAAASLDYLAGQVYTSPRWSNVSGLTKDELLQGRQELRAALGVAPGATSQQVVDGLTSAGQALVADDRAGALRSLGAPVFPAGGERTLAVLSNMPYLRTANIATMRLGNQLFEDDSDNRP